MVSDAEAHASEDRMQRELAEARNLAENAAYQAEKQLAELGDTVDADSKAEIEAAIKEAREALDSQSAEEIRAKAEAVQAAFHRVSEQIYQAASEQAAASTDGASGNGAAEEEVVDAEVVEDDK